MAPRIGVKQTANGMWVVCEYGKPLIGMVRATKPEAAALAREVRRFERRSWREARA